MNQLRMLGVAVSSLFKGTEEPVPFTQAELTRTEIGKRLPRGFILGAASAAHQIEGGLDNDWAEWERGSYPDGKPHIIDRTDSSVACDSWSRFDDDLRCLTELGANGYRLSVEWARLQPTEGAWNAEAADRYRSWLRKLKGAGIQRMVTLSHFTLPKWIARDGGWTNPRTVDRFEGFVTRCVEAFGKDVDLWCSFNEPNVLAIQGYIRGIWPPGLKDTKLAAEAFAMQLRAHARVVGMLRKTGVPVGVAHHVRAFAPARWWHPVDRILTGITDDFVNEVVMNAYRTGRIQIYVPGQANIDEEVPNLKGSFDYLGLNYYSRDHVQTDFKDPAMSRQFVPAGRPVNDLGWEIYAEGLYTLLKRYRRERLPIYVTENGIPDDAGTKRAPFLRAHLYAIEQAMAEGADVRGYFHWSLTDNFEWAEGYTARFGLYRVDFTSPDRKRTPTAGAEEFQQIARRAGLKPQTGAPRAAAGAR